MGYRKSDPAYTAMWLDSVCTLTVMAIITGRNKNASESDPACLLGGEGLCEEEHHGNFLLVTRQETLLGQAPSLLLFVTKRRPGSAAMLC